MHFPLNQDWKQYLEEELNDSSFKKIEDNLAREKEYYPVKEHVFNAFNQCPLDKVKVVIMGQDPYHGVGEAHGLSFSVPNGVKIPPSLKNIYKNLNLDFGFAIPSSGNLTAWANQGVLLLNSALTVRPNQAGSHSTIGWHWFTDRVIEKLGRDCKGLVFMLWGNYAQQKLMLIEKSNHLILTSVHPSPLSAYRGFLENKHFSKANAYLVEHGKHPVDWQLT